MPDIVEKIFKEKQFNDFKLKLQGTYNKRDYCVQYRETDFNFVSRLLEEEGIHYFFEHEAGKHTMVLADNPQENKPCPRQKTARYQISGGGRLEEDIINGLDRMKEIRPAKYTLNDFNFTIPNTDLRASIPSNTRLGPGEREIYDYPGVYALKNEGDRLARIRMEEEEARITSIVGGSTCRAFTSGYRFTLTSYFRKDMDSKDYVLTMVEHAAEQKLDQSAPAKYSNRFSCIPFDVPFRPPRLSPKPVVHGAQTAIVVGPKGDEIHTDEHGRVKVQFHWDREGKKDENSSCWIRVAQVWAGAGWGAIHIPRIGQEVIIDFLEGDPDRPIITGRVYHGLNTPPYELPGNATQSGVRSRSSKGGTADNYNEIRFEDKKGCEQLLVHAERNMDTTIEADETRDVGGNRDVHVKGHFTENIDSGETRKVDAGSEETINGGAKQTVNGGMNQTISGGETRNVSGGLKENILGGETRTVVGGLTETISGAETRTVNGALTETITGGITQNVTGGVTVSTTGPYLVSAAGGYTVIAPGGTKVVDESILATGGKYFFQYGIKLGIQASKVDTTMTMAMSAQPLKVDRTDTSIANTGLKAEKVGISTKSVGVDAEMGDVKLLNKSVSLFL